MHHEKYLRTFGEMGKVTLNPGGVIKSKLADRRIKCMVLGYASSYAGNVSNTEPPNKKGFDYKGY